MLRLEKSNVKKNIATAYSKKLSGQGYSYVMKMKYSDFQFYIKPGKKSLYVWSIWSIGSTWKSCG